MQMLKVIHLKIAYILNWMMGWLNGANQQSININTLTLLNDFYMMHAQNGYAITLDHILME